MIHRSMCAHLGLYLLLISSPQGSRADCPLDPIHSWLLSVSYAGIFSCTLSADPGLSHGWGGAWDHLWCGLHFMPNHLDLQTFITCQTGSWSCPCLAFSTGPKLPSNRPNALNSPKPAKPTLGAAKLWAVASHFLFPSNAPNPPNPLKPAKLALGAAKLWAVANQIFPFLLA